MITWPPSRPGRGYGHPGSSKLSGIPVESRAAEQPRPAGRRHLRFRFFPGGSLFRQPDVSLLQVSGTAAIDEKGASLHPGDVRAQIDCTFDKIAALIGQEGARLTDIAAACVFVKRPEDALAYQERAAAQGLSNLPVVIMVADICREDLLFEIDAEVAFDPSLRGF